MLHSNTFGAARIDPDCKRNGRMHAHSTLVVEIPRGRHTESEKTLMLGGSPLLRFPWSTPLQLWRSVGCEGGLPTTHNMF